MFEISSERKKSVRNSFHPFLAFSSSYKRESLLTFCFAQAEGGGDDEQKEVASLCLSSSRSLAKVETLVTGGQADKALSFIVTLFECREVLFGV